MKVGAPKAGLAPKAAATPASPFCGPAEPGRGPPKAPEMSGAPVGVARAELAVDVGFPALMKMRPAEDDDTPLQEGVVNQCSLSVV